MKSLKEINQAIIKNRDEILPCLLANYVNNTKKQENPDLKEEKEYILFFVKKTKSIDEIVKIMPDLQKDYNRIKSKCEICSTLYSSTINSLCKIFYDSLEFEDNNTLLEESYKNLEVLEEVFFKNGCESLLLNLDKLFSISQTYNLPENKIIIEEDKLEKQDRELLKDLYVF